MDRKFIKGDSIEDCLDSIDLILQSWAPRLSTHVVCMVPPVPILHNQRVADTEGCIFAGILPFSGRISKAFLVIGKYKVKPITLRIDIYSEITRTGAKLECERPLVTYSHNIRINAGDVIRVRITPVDGAEEFLIGLLCHPDISSEDKEERLISELRMLDSMKEL